MAERGWWEDYRCGCVSEIVEAKRDLPGYCGTHGEDRRQVWRGTGAPHGPWVSADPDPAEEPTK